MTKFIAALRALAVGVLSTEPALVVGVGVAAVSGVLTQVHLTAPVTTVTIVVTVILGAVTTRLNVTPTK